MLLVPGFSHIVAALTVAAAVASRQPPFGTGKNNGSLSEPSYELALGHGASFEGPMYGCAGARIGVVLSLQSCANANRKTVRSTSLTSWGPRKRGQYDVGLPHRSISCKHLLIHLHMRLLKTRIADGRFIVECVVDPEKDSASVSFKMQSLRPSVIYGCILIGFQRKAAWRMIKYRYELS